MQKAVGKIGIGFNQSEGKTKEFGYARKFSRFDSF